VEKYSEKFAFPKLPKAGCIASPLAISFKERYRFPDKF